MPSSGRHAATTNEFECHGHAREYLKQPRHGAQDKADMLGGMTTMKKKTQGQMHPNND
jgi:hypothetical protein